ncbi:MAG: TonB-dependent receptor domain-containing protein [Neisseriaceae bacterium]
MGKRKKIVLELLAGLSCSLSIDAARANAQDDVQTLDDVVVIGRTVDVQDRSGHAKVYDKDLSSAYLGKAELNRNKGKSVADLIKGMPGVFSGDARNSGSLDVNIRGIQGPGRVPVTIDGTEQGVTVYRGYYGASNRNYIDPSLVSSMVVEKGGSLTEGVKTSVGGGVAIKTLSIDDVVPQGERYGADIMVDGSSNTTKPRMPDTSIIGKDYRDYPELYKQFDYMTHPNLVKSPKAQGGSNQWLNGQDQSIRVAVGTRQERFDLMAAVSYRQQGNYFAGKGGVAKYQAPLGQEHESLGEGFMPYVAALYPAGSEVLNTSSTMKSALLKNTWYLPQGQTLQFGARWSDIQHGEIMPSRLIWSKDGGQQQWPIGKVEQKAYNLEYAWNPKDNPWVNARINLWQTQTNSRTYTSGMSVFEMPKMDHEWNSCVKYGGGDPKQCPRLDGFFPFEDHAFVHAQNNRWGVTASNSIQLLPQLDWRLGADFQRESLKSDTKTREGKRQEYNLSFNFDWRPTDWLHINAGAKREAYWAKDTLLAEKMAQQENWIVGKQYMNLSVNRTLNQEEHDFYEGMQDKRKSMGFRQFSQWLKTEPELAARYQTMNGAMRTKGQSKYLEEQYQYHQRDDGRYHRADNPYLNGVIADEQVINPYTGEKEDRYRYVGNTIHSQPITDEETQKALQKKSGHAWSPILSASLKLSEDARVYVRYAEAKRFPSMFESTMGFSTMPRALVDIKPEHSRNFEVGYVHDLTQWLPTAQASDLKLTYYDMTIKNVIERDVDMNFAQLDKQKNRGLELQARYDGTRFFGSVGVNYNLENKTCDESLSMRMGVTGLFPSCVDGGFPVGYLRTNLTPRYSANLTLGGRFDQNRLELGTRVFYHSRANNKQEQDMAEKGLLDGNNNNPIRWQPVVLVDAFLKYQLAKNLSVELTGNNLTNRYYIDPLTRSFMPAPGRTWRLGVQGKF